MLSWYSSNLSRNANILFKYIWVVCYALNACQKTTSHAIRRISLFVSACEAVDCGPGSCSVVDEQTYICVCNAGDYRVNASCPIIPILCGGRYCFHIEVCVDNVCKCKETPPDCKWKFVLLHTIAKAWIINMKTVGLWHSFTPYLCVSKGIRISNFNPVTSLCFEASIGTLFRGEVTLAITLIGAGVGVKTYPRQIIFPLLNLMPWELKTIEPEKLYFFRRIHANGSHCVLKLTGLDLHSKKSYSHLIAWLVCDAIALCTLWPSYHHNTKLALTSFWSKDPNLWF